MNNFIYKAAYATIIILDKIKTLGTKIQKKENIGQNIEKKSIKIIDNIIALWLQCNLFCRFCQCVYKKISPILLRRDLILLNCPFYYFANTVACYAKKSKSK